MYSGVPQGAWAQVWRFWRIVGVFTRLYEAFTGIYTLFYGAKVRNYPVNPVISRVNKCCRVIAVTVYLSKTCAPRAIGDVIPLLPEEL